LRYKSDDLSLSRVAENGYSSAQAYYPERNAYQRVANIGAKKNENSMSGMNNMNNMKNMNGMNNMRGMNNMNNSAAAMPDAATGRNNIHVPQSCNGNPSLAMVYVPVQKWENIYTPSVGLERGTIFKELDKPFYGGRRR